MFRLFQCAEEQKYIDKSIERSIKQRQMLLAYQQAVYDREFPPLPNKGIKSHEVTPTPCNTPGKL